MERLRTILVAVLPTLIINSSCYDDATAGHEDVAALAGQDVTTPVCGLGGVVSGPGHAPCQTLNTDCSTGVFDPKHSCCFSAARAPGIACGGLASDSLGQCDHDGQCAAPSPGADPEDRDGDGVVDKVDRVLGDASWLRSTVAPLTQWEDDDSLSISMEGERIAVLKLAANHESVTQKEAAVVAPLNLSHLSLSRSASQKSAAPDLEAVALQGAPGTVALFLPQRAEALCFATVQNPSFAGDCGDEARIACPGKLGDLRCSQDGDQWRIEGEGLLAAWVPVDGGPSDIRLIGGWFVPQYPFPEPLPEGDREWLLRIEFCNGIDDDGDGVIDESFHPSGSLDRLGSLLCNDNLACTSDRCVAGRCINDAGSEGAGVGCRSGAACAVPFCGTPPALAAGERASAINGNGCGLVLRDTYCTNTWDGCACNGVEQCDPSRANSREWATNHGCVAVTPPTALPCERANGDGDGCTIESCCEPFNPAACRLHRLALAQQGPAARTAFNALCGTPSTPGAGGVWCPNPPFRNLLPRGAQCNDANSCTTDACQSPTGLCTNTTLADGPQTGCSGTVSRGCAQLQCQSGACVPTAAVPNPAIATDCFGFAEITDGYSLNFGSCLRQSCDANNQCVLTPVPSLCDNGEWCDGAEQCSLASALMSLGPRARLTGAARATGGPVGCGMGTNPCDDGFDCTVDACMGPGECAHAPADQRCYDAYGVAPNVCAPMLACRPSQTADSFGCVALRETSPCEDGDACTIDQCACADELCTTPLCTHAPNPACYYDPGPIAPPQR